MCLKQWQVPEAAMYHGPTIRNDGGGGGVRSRAKESNINTAMCNDGGGERALWGLNHKQYIIKAMTQGMGLHLGLSTK